MGGANAEGLTMGLGGSGDMGGSLDLGALGATTATQYGTTGTTTTTTTVQNFSTSSQPIIGGTNILEPIVNTSVNQPIVAGDSLPTLQDQIISNP